jgi:pyruvate/2-oxoglutarate dehydrogenase complex dihydrolipoamide acyltransferase (E2) component
MGTNRLIYAPISALRAVFTGVGRVVMVADRPEDAPGQAGNGVQWRSLDLTGNVRLLSADDLDDGRIVVAQAAPPEAQAAPPEAQAAPPEAQAAPPGVQASAEPEADAVELPLDNYDNLTLPSIRARLRGLDVAQLRVLAAYERTHAERPEVLGMFERRISRLETGR